MELDEGATDRDARAARRTRRHRREAERAVLGCRLLGCRREERDVIEVVLNVGLRLYESEPNAFADVEIRLACLRTLELETVRQLRERRVERGDAKRDVLERTALARPFRIEQRQLSAPCVRADQREALGLVDHVQSEVRGEEVGDRIAGG